MPSIRAKFLDLPKNISQKTSFSISFIRMRSSFKTQCLEYLYPRQFFLNRQRRTDFYRPKIIARSVRTESTSNNEPIDHPLYSLPYATFINNQLPKEVLRNSRTDRSPPPKRVSASTRTLPLYSWREPVFAIHQSFPAFSSPLETTSGSFHEATRRRS